ncbi:MAG: hypothetical protein BWY14_01280 [Parcubacteria group bacterium ADurb.Bin192]|nr:MAG: hypothetical protein BWY14_01280 [Parcubacteria group bacterium ADurb.Bin192]
MDITPNNIKEYRSEIGESEGGIMSDIEITSPDDALFPDIESDEAKSGGFKYRKIFRKNCHKSIDWKNVISWIKSQPTNAKLSVGLGLNHKDDDDPDQGNMSALNSESAIAISSDGPDKRHVVIVGEDASGENQTEVLVLNDTAEVLGSKIFSELHAVYVESVDKTRTVIIKQGQDSDLLGSINPGKKISFLWFEDDEIDSKAKGIRHGNIHAGDCLGLWYRLAWPAETEAVSGNSIQVASESEVEQ